MIINNLWYPTTTNKRTLWWARRHFRAPRWEIAWLAAGMLFLPASLVIVQVVSNDASKFFVAVSLLILLGYMLYEVYCPLQKYSGISVNGERFRVLRPYLNVSLEELVADPGSHRMIDDYLEKTEDDAFQVALYTHGRRHSSFIFDQSFARLDQQAYLLSYQLTHWVRQLRQRQELDKSKE